MWYFTAKHLYSIKNKEYSEVKNMEKEVENKWDVVLDNQPKENLQVIKAKINKVLRDKYGDD